MKQFVLFIWLICCFYLPVRAQNITNFSYRLQGDTIVVNYDLEGANRPVIVQLFSSHNNFSSPLERIKGDVGAEILPGPRKVITWKAKEELGEFKGNINIKLSARYAPFLELDDSSIVESYRRGKLYSIQLETNVEEEVRWSLDQGRAELLTGSWTANSTRFEIEIPRDQKTGKDYRLVLTTKNGLRDVSNPFRIKAKYPLILKAVPFLVVGAAIPILWPPPPGPEEIPDPFLPE